MRFQDIHSSIDYRAHNTDMEYMDADEAHELISEYAQLNVEYMADVYGGDAEHTASMIHAFSTLSSDSFNNFVFIVDRSHLTGAILGTVTNLFVMTVLLTIKGTLRSTLKLVLCLTVTDVAYAAFHIMIVYYPIDSFYSFMNTDKVLYTTVYEYLFRRFLSDTFRLTELSGYVVVLVLAVDLYLAVRKPLSYNSLMTKHRGNVIIALVWITCYIPILCVTLYIEVQNADRPLTDVLERSKVSLEYLNTCIMQRNIQDGFFLILVALYTAIVFEIRRNMIQSLSTAKQTKLALVLGMIIFSFLLTNAPFVYPILTVNKLGVRSSYVWNILRVTNAFRGVFNAFIYSIRLPEVRRQCRRMLGLERIRLPRANVSVTSTTTVVSS